MKDIFTKKNKNKIKKLARELIICLGDDPDRPGMKDTPDRFARACEEWFEGMQYTNEEIASKFNKCFTGYSNDLQVISGIKVFSHCEHHIALMYDMTVTVGYIPNGGKVIGLSKIHRICEMAARRFQIQENLCKDISDIISLVTDSEDVIVVIKGKHACVTSRGAKQDGDDSFFYSSRITGRFESNSDLRNEFYNFVK